MRVRGVWKMLELKTTIVNHGIEMVDPIIRISKWDYHGIINNYLDI